MALTTMHLNAEIILGPYVSRANKVKGGLAKEPISPAVVDDDDEVMLNVLRCQMTY